MFKSNSKIKEINNGIEINGIDYHYGECTVGGVKFNYIKDYAHLDVVKYFPKSWRLNDDAMDGEIRGVVVEVKEGEEKVLIEWYGSLKGRSGRFLQQTWENSEDLKPVYLAS